MTHDLHGTLTLQSEDVASAYKSPPGSRCSGAGGFSDLDIGAGVTVTDQAGRIVGTSSISSSSKGDPKTCTFTFDVPGVPNRSFYKVEVSHRGGITYSYNQLQTAGWSIATTIG